MMNRWNGTRRWGQIGLIAGFRLTDVVATPAGVEIMAMNERLALSSDGTGVDGTGVGREALPCCANGCWQPASMYRLPAAAT